MDLQNMDLQGGSLQISTEVVGKIARCAALEVDGVAEVSCGVQNKKLKSLLESASIQPPVVVEMRDGTASITLHLNADLRHILHNGHQIGVRVVDGDDAPGAKKPHQTAFPAQVL